MTPCVFFSPGTGAQGARLDSLDSLCFQPCSPAGVPGLQGSPPQFTVTLVGEYFLSAVTPPAHIVFPCSLAGDPGPPMSPLRQTAAVPGTSSARLPAGAPMAPAVPRLAGVCSRSWARPAPHLHCTPFHAPAEDLAPAESGRPAGFFPASPLH